MSGFDRPELSAEERERLFRVYADLKALVNSPVPSVRAAARAALAQVHSAVNGQGLEYELYSKDFSSEPA